MTPLRPSRLRLTIGAVTSPDTSKLSLPLPPSMVVTTPARVLWMKKWSSPSAPSTSSDSMLS